MYQNMYKQEVTLKCQTVTCAAADENVLFKYSSSGQKWVDLLILFVFSGESG